MKANGDPACGGTNGEPVHVDGPLVVFVTIAVAVEPGWRHRPAEKER